LKKKRFSLSTTQTVLLSFLLVILVGSVLLSLPISTKNGEGIRYIDSLFTAVTATCVTGLVTVPVAETFSFFGQAVILLLIEIGGLGFITVITAFMVILKKKLGISNRILLQDAFNLNSLSGIVRFVKKVAAGTLLVQLAGALLYMPVFVSDFGARGIWISLFNAVSAFCNAGIDVIGTDSLMGYAVNPVINAVTAALIILGGIGFVVWWDVLDAFRNIKKRGFRCFKGLSLHSKLAIFITLILIVSGTALIFIFEYSNPKTIGEMGLFDKLQVSFFQSVTTRTAGFATIPQENLTDSSSLLSMILMLIGGSPVSTAGGMKTVTIGVLVLEAVSVIKNKEDVTAFNRNIPQKAVKKAVTVALVFFFSAAVSTILLSLFTDAGVLDVIYEVVSAVATVGLTRGLTPHLEDIGKLIIILTMYIGRIGPLSLVFAFHIKNKNENTVKNPSEDISVG
jgi:trk system potassium uptake protein TrkH